MFLLANAKGIDRSATLCRRRAKGVQMQNSPDGEEVIDELGEEVIDEFGRSIFQTVSDEEMKEYDQTEPGILENESFATFLRVGKEVDHLGDAVCYLLAPYQVQLSLAPDQLIVDLVCPFCRLHI